MISLNLKPGDKVFYFHPEDSHCWADSKETRKIIESTVVSCDDTTVPPHGKRYGIVEDGNPDCVSYIFDSFFKSCSGKTPSCFLTKETAEQAIRDAGYEVGESEKKEQMPEEEPLAFSYWNIDAKCSDNATAEMLANDIRDILFSEYDEVNVSGRNVYVFCYQNIKNELFGELSAKYPGTLISAEYYGEADEIGIVYAKDGKYYAELAEVIFPKFDKSKLTS